MVTWQYDYVCFKAGAFYPTAVPSTPPTAPSNLAAAAATPTRVNLSWTDTANNETGVKIERKVGAGAYAEIAQAPADATSYVDMTTLANTTYTYRVRATNAAGDSAYSNEATVTTPAEALGARDWQRYEKK
jgi:fibronectin type 3 domain-containing protein